MKPNTVQILKEMSRSQSPQERYRLHPLSGSWSTADVRRDFSTCLDAMTDPWRLLAVLAARGFAPASPGTASHLSW